MEELGGRYHVESKNGFVLYLLISILKSSIPWVFKSGLVRKSIVFYYYYYYYYYYYNDI